MHMSKKFSDLSYLEPSAISTTQISTAGPAIVIGHKISVISRTTQRKLLTIRSEILYPKQELSSLGSNVNWLALLSDGKICTAIGRLA